MKLKNKGKIFPSPSPSPTPSSSSSSDVLNLLPSAIFSLALLLSLEDREVLAYLITKSINTTTTGTVRDRSGKISGKKTHTHKPPVFFCDCFDCYTSYWFRWDSSPNRELIHQAIDAFEDHLANGEQSKKQARGKRKVGPRRVVENPIDDVVGSPEFKLETSLDVVVSPETEVFPEESGGSVSEEVIMPEVLVVEEFPTAAKNLAASCHKGLARKVLPDLMGLFDSRLWNLWNPNA